VSLANTARQCGVTIVTGDTKVVERGKGDGVFINTSGIGLLATDLPIDPLAIEPGDRIFVSGDLGRHGVAILAARHGLDLHPPLASDCAPLWPVVESLLTAGVQLHCLRDLTRGGLASALAELSAASGLEFLVEEETIPVAMPVARTCELLGFEPLHLANEGRLVAVVPERSAAATLQILEPLGGALIGEVRADAARVLLRTRFGSERVLVPLSGELLPRIC
jgi:hydrogenase expression/formation protein HypE